MFFLVFWTAYIPVALIILSLIGEWLKQCFRDFRAHAAVTSSDRPKKQRAPLAPKMPR